MTKASARQQDIATRRKYPYVDAWGINLGSFEYYRTGECEIAAEDKVPVDVIYRKNFDSISQRERDEALQAERDGIAVVLRDDDGKPYRVWYRVNVISYEDTRQRVTEMALRLQAGEPARG